MRRVLHLIDRNTDTSYFRLIARHHDRDRYPVSIGSLETDGALQAAMRERGIPTFSLGAGSRRDYLSALRRLKAELDEQGASILHAHCFDPTLLAALVSRRSNVRFVFTRHHSDHHIRLGKRWHTRIDAACARRADAVIAVSNATRNIMLDVERVPTAKISVVFNGMEMAPVPSPDAVLALQRELHLEGRRTLLVVGRLHEEKGHGVLLDAFPTIRAAVGPIRALFAGEGIARRSLQAEIEARGLGADVSLLGQRLDVPELLAASDLVVLPSLAESFGFAAIEALAAGRPLVVSDAGGLPEVVGDAAVVVPRGDASALSDAAIDILGNPALARRLSGAGPSRAAVFSPDAMMRGYETVYEKLVP